MDQSLTSEKLNFLHQLLDKELEGLKDSSLSNSEMRSHPIINHSEVPLRSRLQSTGNNNNMNNNQMLNEHNLQAAGATSILENSLNVSSLHQRSDSLTSSKDNNNNSYFSQKFRQASNNNINIFPDDLNSEMTFQAKGMMQFKQQQSEQQQQQQQQQQQNVLKQPNDSGERSARISSDLQELQNKIMKLEKKIVHINAGQHNEDKENEFAGNQRSYDGYDRDIHRQRDKNIQNDDAAAKTLPNHNNYETFSTLRESDENGDGGLFDQDTDQLKSKVCYSQDTQDKGDEDETPMKQKYYESNKKHNSKRQHYQDTNDDDQHSDSRLFHTEMSHHDQIQCKRQSSIKRGRSSSSSAIKGQTSEKHHNNSINKYSLERKIEQAEGKLNNSKNSLKKKSVSSRNNSSNGTGTGGGNSQRSSSGNIRKNSITSGSQQGNTDGYNTGQHNNSHNEVQILNKRLMQMKKQQDIDRENLIKERLRSNELQEEVDRLNRKMKKMANQIDKSTAIDEDYKKLMQSFEKSEFIRQQQKQLIMSLKAEIDAAKKIESDRRRPKSRSKQL